MFKTLAKFVRPLMAQRNKLRSGCWIIGSCGKESTILNNPEEPCDHIGRDGAFLSCVFIVAPEEWIVCRPRAVARE